MPMGSLESAVEMAGFLAAHGIWCVADGDALVPMLGYQCAVGPPRMVRLVTESMERAVADGREWLATNPEDAARGVLVYDSYVTLPGGRTDALALELRAYDAGPRSLTMAVPYRPAGSDAGFAVYRPKFVDLQPDGAEPDYDDLGAAFFRGVDRHEKGAEVWNAHLDQTR